MEPCRPVLKIEGKVSFNENGITELHRKTHALANPIRLKILKLLVEYGELCVCEMERALELKQSKISYHLGLLMEGGLVKRRQSGPWSFYSLSEDGYSALQLLNFK